MGGKRLTGKNGTDGVSATFSKYLSTCKQYSWASDNSRGTFGGMLMLGKESTQFKSEYYLHRPLSLYIIEVNVCEREGREFTFFIFHYRKLINNM